MTSSQETTSYNKYVVQESDTNVRKFTFTSLTSDELAMICKYFREHAHEALADDLFFGLCLGVRNGAEVRSFSRRLGRRFIGTDISRTILQVPDGVLCDFSHSPELWNSAVDLLYSNSYDHAADLDATLGVWQRLLADRGVMFLQFTSAHALDTRLKLDDLLEKLRRQNFRIEAVLNVAAPGTIRSVLNSVINLIRQIVRRVVAPLLPKSSKLHWTLGYNLRRGVLQQTSVIVARKA